MYQKDFILRMLEMLAELIAALLGLIKKGDLQQAAQVLDRAYVDFLKEDAVFFRKLPVEGICEKLLEEHNYSHGHLKVLSELFYAEAELQVAEGRGESAREFYEKSLALIDFVERDSITFSMETQSRIHELKDKIVRN